MILDDARDGGFLDLLFCLFMAPAFCWLLSIYAPLGGEGLRIAMLAYVAAGLGALLLAVILGSSWLAGADRARMSLLFGPSVRGVMLLLAAAVFVQALLVVDTVSSLEIVDNTFGRYGWPIEAFYAGLLGAGGTGALFVCLTLIRFGLFRTKPDSVRGMLLTAATAPALIGAVNRLAERLGAEAPNHVVVGLEPEFFATAAPLRLEGTQDILTGRTLFVSLAWMTLFSRDELDAVIGHELGHFRGEDTVYSMKFAPTYARLTQTLQLLGQSDGFVADIGKVPAIVALTFCLSRFERPARKVERQRELLADRAAAEAASPRAFATALLKMSVFSANWDWVLDELVKALDQGQSYLRLADFFGAASQLTEETVWGDIVGEIGASVQADPFQTHPSLAERLESLGLSLGELTPDDCLSSEDPAIGLIPDASRIDEDLSGLEVRWLLATGGATLPPSAGPAPRGA